MVLSDGSWRSGREAPAALFQLDPSREAQTAELIRIMAPALALQGFSAIFTAMLQIHGRFAGPAAVGVAFNFGIIVGRHHRAGRIGIEAAGWGVVARRHRCRCCCSCRSSGGCCARPTRGPALDPPAPGRGRRCSPLPVLGASLLQQINSFTDKLFASSLEAGRVSALSFANALGQAPRVALLLPLLTPLFPLIARLISEGREREALGAFRRVAGLLGLVAIPMMLLLAIYAQEVAQLAFERGKCGPGCVDQISPPLAFYALGLWPAFAGAPAQPHPVGRQHAARHPLDHHRHGRPHDRPRPRPARPDGAVGPRPGRRPSASTPTRRDAADCLRRHFPACRCARSARRQVRMLVAGGRSAP